MSNEQPTIDDVMVRQAAHLEKDGLFCLRELFSLIPQNHEFDLPSGARARFVIQSQPSLHKRRPQGMVDARITAGACDHFGFQVKLTDSGGWVAGGAELVGKVIDGKGEDAS